MGLFPKRVIKGKQKKKWLTAGRKKPASFGRLAGIYKLHRLADLDTCTPANIEEYKNKSKTFKLFIISLIYNHS